MSFPKIRKKLPEEYQAIYQLYELKNRTGGTAATSLSKRMEGWMHRQIAADVKNTSVDPVTLEIGAGTLNHLPYEPRIAHYDIVEPENRLYEGSPDLARIRRRFSVIDDVPESQVYDRIISIAAFEHICDVPNVVARCKKLLKPGGQLRIAIPSEGGLLWQLGWRLTTGLEFWLKHRLDYAVIMEYVHVNKADEIEAILRDSFTTIEHKCMGLSRSLSFYQVFICRNS